MEKARVERGREFERAREERGRELTVLKAPTMSRKREKHEKT